jgi:penicillin-binding protein 2
LHLPDRHFNWREVQASDVDRAPVVDSKRRSRLLLAGFMLAGTLIVSRAVHIDLTQGADYRRVAARPAVIRTELPARRGRILARDGTVLAAARPSVQLFVNYRWLEEPPNEDWLRRTAQRRLNRADRKDPARLAAEISRVRVEQFELNRRLAAQVGDVAGEWSRRRRGIQDRVERIAASVNRRRVARAEAEQTPASSIGDGLWESIREAVYQAITDPEPPASLSPVIVAEELDFHLMADDLLPEAHDRIAAEFEGHPAVEVRKALRREYPQGELAGNLLGHLGAIDQDLAHEAGLVAFTQDDRIGRMGLERRYEPRLHGRPGFQVRVASRPSEIVDQIDARAGDDISIAIDVDLQRTAEGLLDSAIALLGAERQNGPPISGAAIVMDCLTGDLLAAASAPRFDPNVFELQAQDRRAADEVARLLIDPAHPMFDRVSQMALPPGSLVKLATAAAILEEGAAQLQTPFYCQGYLRSPQRHRCYIYQHFGVGHGEETLARALAESCNVYFFHYAAQMGAPPLVNWYQQFGLGRVSGVDLPHESSGRLPTPETIKQLDGRPWSEDDTLAVAIGQGSLTATPLQIARLVAAVANGGRLVTPRLLREDAILAGVRPDRGRIPLLSDQTLANIREGMEMAVASADGTAHPYLASVEAPVAAKTGTAETDEPGMDHAWIAGYAPADAPRYVFVVALEHAGGGAKAAGPVAKRILSTMERLGYFQK